MKKREKRLGHFLKDSHVLRATALGVLLSSNFAYAIAQHQKFSGKFVNAKATTVLESVIKKTGIYCVYNAELLRNVKITADAHNEDISVFGIVFRAL